MPYEITGFDSFFKGFYITREGNMYSSSPKYSWRAGLNLASFGFDSDENHVKRTLEGGKKTEYFTVIEQLENKK